MTIRLRQCEISSLDEPKHNCNGFAGWAASDMSRVRLEFDADPETCQRIMAWFKDPHRGPVPADAPKLTAGAPALPAGTLDGELVEDE